MGDRGLNEHLYYPFMKGFIVADNLLTPLVHITPFAESKLQKFRRIDQRVVQSVDPLLKNLKYFRSFGEATFVFCTKDFALGTMSPVMIRPSLPLANIG